jgi:hypothetical protein
MRHQIIRRHRSLLNIGDSLNHSRFNPVNSPQKFHALALGLTLPSSVPGSQRLEQRRIKWNHLVRTSCSQSLELEQIHPIQSDRDLLKAR